VEGLVQPWLGDGGGCAEARKNGDDDFFWCDAHPPSLTWTDGWGEERRAGAADEKKQA